MQPDRCSRALNSEWRHQCFPDLHWLLPFNHSLAKSLGRFLTVGRQPMDTRTRIQAPDSRLLGPPCTFSGQLKSETK